MKIVSRLLVAVLYSASAVPFSTTAWAQAINDEWISRQISPPQLAQSEVEDYLEARIPPVPHFSSAADWQAMADQMRTEALTRVVYRGTPDSWREGRANVEWLNIIDGGPEYRIRKLRFEAVPGLWIPALLYEPKSLSHKTPVMLNVNGHDPLGKAAVYKQIRCINQAKRGMLALNVEWFQMGQLRTNGNAHGRLNQLDLCGVSGLAPFYMSMKRSLDLLLDHPFADPTRVAVSGLSGGGWQTILISALDTRVTLSNPVAGYSSFRTRIRNYSDLGDSEQTPVDLGIVSDYAQLTAMLAPRPALLTYNAKDNCCFASGHALPPLLTAAEPVYKLYGKLDNLRSHVNYDPGTHNFERDNREAHYRMVGDHFYPGDNTFQRDEIPCQDEVRTAEQLAVDVPAHNPTLHSLALGFAQQLPRNAELPTSRDQAKTWSAQKLVDLRKVIAAKDYTVLGHKLAVERSGKLQVTHWRLRAGDVWTVPAVEIAPDDATTTALVLDDAGRKGATARISALVESGCRVVAIDPFYFGESKMASRDYLWALLISTVGDRPLGIQASQVAGVARWLKTDQQLPILVVDANGERSSLFGLIAAAIEPQIDEVRCTSSFGSLREIVERDYSFEKAPELFCFGLLDHFDIGQLVALVAPRPVTMREPTDRVKVELSKLKAFYRLSDKEFSPID